ncbi:hypothetical protein FC27_GL001935 [Companilactobacillus versmoldensis DSM 14857 = KCTC 3814]|uniref:Uncharacterized protein n=1 Tax=Companilactobacillus versmoldensis DSM 14857 = KCTC 3814 TaxID=1423815 RepID=A0A0R1SDU1_9LACO|nr:hypothetical protein FC27_GL001935 [Companilactobacillus versmoldensis DSM 14857 = KCTC 3814]
MPYALQIASQGLAYASKNNTVFTGINTFDGKLTEKAVAESLKMPYAPFSSSTPSMS